LQTDERAVHLRRIALERVDVAAVEHDQHALQDGEERGVPARSRLSAHRRPAAARAASHVVPEDEQQLTPGGASAQAELGKDGYL
jgi:hypothetical protein